MTPLESMTKDRDRAVDAWRTAETKIGALTFQLSEANTKVEMWKKAFEDLKATKDEE